MITMTAKAQEKTKSFLAEKNDAKYLRLYVEGGGCSGFQYGLSLETEKEEADKIYEFDGVAVIVDPASLSYVEDAEIDYAEAFEQSGFSIKNPKAKSTCGCGKSNSF